MKNSNEQIICFDLFDTLISTPDGSGYKEELITLLKQKGIEGNSFNERIYKFVRDNLMTRNHNFKEMVKRLSLFLGIDLNQDEASLLENKWAEENTQAEWIDDAEQIISEIRSKVENKIVLISNVTAPGWEIVDKKLEIRKRFNNVFLSFEKGIAKPNPKVWEAVEKIYNRAGSYLMIGNDKKDDLEVPFSRRWNVGLTGNGKSLNNLISNNINKESSVPSAATKYIILDVDIDADELKSLSDMPCEILDIKEFSKTIMEWEGWNGMDPNTTVLIFPGNGGSLIKGTLEDEWLKKWPLKFKVDIKRVWCPGVDPTVEGGEIYPQIMLTDIKNVVIIDDAVSSGATAGKIMNKNKLWFPGAKWSVVTWVSQRASDTKGFERLYYGALVGERNKKAPLNSLSTLLQDRSIANSYASRNIPGKSNEFLALLERIKNKQPK